SALDPAGPGVGPGNVVGASRGFRGRLRAGARGMHRRGGDLPACAQPGGRPSRGQLSPGGGGRLRHPRRRRPAAPAADHRHLDVGRPRGAAVKLLLLSAALLLAQADAGVAERRVKITVRAIAASNDAAIPAGTDPKLKPIGPQLESFGEQFRFRSYRLIDERSFDLDWKNAAEVELP